MADKKIENCVAVILRHPRVSDAERRLVEGVKSHPTAIILQIAQSKDEMSLGVPEIA